MSAYDHKAVEKKWQKKWEEANAFNTPEDSKLPKYYVLDMFPYPSGAGLHVGHVEAYTATDIYSRYKRAKGFNVLHPMGWDAFGLPAENYAIKTGTPPQKTTDESINNFRKQLKNLGLSYDWSREFGTHTPEYYRWTQWLFTKFFEKGLVYKKKALVNWDPVDQTVLANEQVLPDGTAERSGAVVEKKELEQWFYKITDYVDELIDGLEKVDWPESTKINQRNWIGRSEGAEIEFETTFGKKIRVFTTRPDTLFGATYTVLAPEHPMVLEMKENIKNWKEVSAYIQQTSAKSEIERTKMSQDKKGAVLEGVLAINPATKEKIPIFIADYVLYGYATGAIMAVPAHDDRDFHFALAHNLNIKKVVERPTDALYQFVTLQDRDSSSQATHIRTLAASSEPVAPTIHMYHVPRVNAGDLVTFLKEGNLGSAEDHGRILAGESFILEQSDSNGIIFADVFAGDGVHINSEFLNGLHNTEAIKKSITWLESNDAGVGKITYRLKDWLISRQRYWGAPIPIVYDPDGKAHAIPEEHLPWKLPEDVEYLPKGTSPLGSSKELFARTEKIFGKGWKPEIDTMDTFACSSWYFLRFADPHNDKEFASKKAMKKWLPVDLYVGGAEHTVLHLLYARFFTKALRDMGYLSFDEPFLKLRHQGIILAEDSRKMSKRWDNVINPDDMVERFGADSVRLYEMFMGPLEAMKPWNTNNILGVRRFLERVWNSAQKVADIPVQKETDILLAQTIDKVSRDIEALKINTAVSSLMILSNHLQELEKIPRSAFQQFLTLLAPLAPHLVSELAEELNVEIKGWPKADPAKLTSDAATVAVQINGKVRGTVELSIGATEEEALSLARANESVKKWIDGKQEKRAVYVPGKIINFVVEG